jgi:ornithine cyclodeaminase/alanine dehydrogenase-like protein (mu-crystallin family)
MPVLYLTEDDVRQVLTIDLAIEAVETGLRKLALDEAVNCPRQRAQTDHCMLHVMSAAAKSIGYLGHKSYVTTRKGAHFHFHLFDGKTGEQLAWMRADFLGQIRTGAASAVATKYMARTDAATVGIFGSGKQARSQVLGLCKVRKIRTVNVYSPNESHRTQFATEMSAACGVEVLPVSSPEQAARDRDIVVTATTTRDPVLKGEWLRDGTHLNVIGSNFLGKAEIDVATIQRCATIVVDSKEQARLEAGDLMPAIEHGVIHWTDVYELGHIITGRYRGREDTSHITLFKSMGIAIEDVATAARVYERAKAAGLGRLLEV